MTVGLSDRVLLYPSPQACLYGIGMTLFPETDHGVQPARAAQQGRFAPLQGAVPAPVQDSRAACSEGPVSSGQRGLRLLVLAHANRTAGPRYVAMHLIQALAGLGQEVQVIPVLPSRCGYEQMAERCALQPVWFGQRRSRAKRLLFDTIVLPRLARQLRPDAILSLGSMGLQRPPAPQAILVQDPHFVYSGWHHGNMVIADRVRYFVQRRQLRLAMARSKVVYGQTPLMLEWLRKTFDVDGRLKVLPKCVAQPPAGAGVRTREAEVLDAHADRFRLVCLCRYYTHKNLEIICDAFEQYGDRLKGAMAFLTISGDHHPHARRLLRRIERSGLSDRIMNLGPVPEADIPACLARSEGLLFPTRMESFSGTYLDAMQAGLPILTSDLDFAHEVCGDAAVYFDPTSPKAMAEAIIRLRSDPSLHRRLAVAGRERLQIAYSESWSDVAARVVADLETHVRAADGQIRPPAQPADVSGAGCVP